MKRFYLLILLGWTTCATASFPIECEGRTEITYIHTQDKTWHRITSYQPIEIDWNQHLLRCLDSGTKPKTQIQFMDAERQVYADNLQIHYHLEKDNLNLDTLTLFGHVKLLQQEFDEETQTTSVQYALADQLDYFHDNKQLFLSARDNQNVLYFDESHHYRMSAPKITVMKNPITDKFLVKGLGAVRFTFEEEELIKIKDNFSRRISEDESK